MEANPLYQNDSRENAQESMEKVPNGKLLLNSNQGKH